MELKDVTKQILEYFECDIDELSETLLKKVRGKDSEKVFKEYAKIIKEEPDTDWLQGLYEFYLSNREELSQDYTPKSLSKLCAELTKTSNEQTVYDCCCGMGSLTLTKNREGLDFICHELDENVIPFLLFNLGFHNINALVINGDVLTGEVKKQYRVTKGKKYGKVTIDSSFLVLEYDSVISNPPFNLKTDFDKEFPSFDLTISKSNHNYSFILHCLDHLKPNGKMAFILPNGVLSDSGSKKTRQYLCDNGYLDAVITCPERMFENTSIPVCILVISKTKRENHPVAMIDEREKYHVDIRDMKGELHMATRTYHKNVNVFSDSQIETICALVDNCINEKGHSKLAPLEKIQKQDYIIQPSRYIELKEELDKSRSFEDIVNDINRISKSKNSCKLTINEKLLKNVDSHDTYKVIMETYELCEKSNEIFDELNLAFEEMMELNDDFEIPKLVKQNFLTVSKKKNMLKFENNNSTLYTRSDMILQLERWRTLIHYLNCEENRYLAELRDKFLPLLMSGELKVM